MQLTENEIFREKFCCKMDNYYGDIENYITSMLNACLYSLLYSYKYSNERSYNGIGKLVRLWKEVRL
jgi:hypothetical protein